MLGISTFAFLTFVGIALVVFNVCVFVYFRFFASSDPKESKNEKRKKRETINYEGLSKETSYKQSVITTTEEEPSEKTRDEEDELFKLLSGGDDADGDKGLVKEKDGADEEAVGEEITAGASVEEEGQVTDKEADHGDMEGEAEDGEEIGPVKEKDSADEEANGDEAGQIEVYGENDIDRSEDEGGQMVSASEVEGLDDFDPDEEHQNGNYEIEVPSSADMEEEEGDATDETKGNVETYGEEEGPVKEKEAGDAVDEAGKSVAANASTEDKGLVKEKEGDGMEVKSDTTDKDKESVGDAGEATFTEDGSMAESEKNSIGELGEDFEQPDTATDEEKELEPWTYDDFLTDDARDFDLDGITMTGYDSHLPPLYIEMSDLEGGGERESLKEAFENPEYVKRTIHVKNVPADENNVVPQAVVRRLMAEASMEKIMMKKKDLSDEVPSAVSTEAATEDSADVDEPLYPDIDATYTGDDEVVSDEEEGPVKEKEASETSSVNEHDDDTVQEDVLVPNDGQIHFPDEEPAVGAVEPVREENGLVTNKDGEAKTAGVTVTEAENESSETHEVVKITLPEDMQPKEQVRFRTSYENERPIKDKEEVTEEMSSTEAVDNKLDETEISLLAKLAEG